MIRVTIQDTRPDGSFVMSHVTIDVQTRNAVAYCHARIDAPDGHKPRLREVEIPGVPDGADAVWLVGEVIRRAHAFAAVAPEREW
jgi:hypothetical protein